MNAVSILKNISPIDIYSSNIAIISSPSREHIVPKIYLNKQMSKDLNNIFICNSLINSQRGILPFNISNHQNNVSKIQLFDGKTGLPICTNANAFVSIKDINMKTKKYFLPPEHSRGPIARTCLYMMNQYPALEVDIVSKVMNHELIINWDNTYPVANWEIIRAHNIYKYGFPMNPFVHKKKSIYL
jgi:endonuclease I